MTNFEAKQEDHQALAARLANVTVSATAAVSDAINAVRKKGGIATNLGEGELDFPTPSHVCQAAVNGIGLGETKYTAIGGTDALKSAVGRKFARENNLHYGPDQVTSGTGAKQMIFNALVATLSPNDEVIVPAPYWVSYPEIVHLASGRA